ncbi:MAG: hypothetical protein Q9166_002189 [cf. Caloplaca sp. 2 TL-2023]
MRSLSHLFSVFAYWTAIPNLTAAEPLRIIHKRQAPTTTAAPRNALDVLREAGGTTGLAATTTGGGGDTPTTTSDDAPSATSESSGQGNIRVSVVQPSLCSESALQFSSNIYFQPARSLSGVRLAGATKARYGTSPQMTE